ncbi:hypothetical protein [Nitrospirillum sp. BR 11828]|uniref:hypothetical protein n=1 Tax=Nitrospirillum sp. BR 11828 TaxID=3104325 RepID=UPI002ACAE4E7|nr:hypothetical protein [Nitrospirillum sp. BR 11828]MDZ5646903.1 hypothetical protein [Nitrospirillum sp. BR 11828]
MKYPVFFSCPKPFLVNQENFLSSIERKLRENDLEPRTLGRTDYDMDAPLEGIRRLMYGCCGLITIALRRTYIEKGQDKPSPNIPDSFEITRDGCWLTSSYCQIEPAMAFQQGLPILLWREKGVLADGILDRGALGISMPEFDLSQNPPNLELDCWKQPLSEWISRVRLVYRNRGTPPRLFS